MKVSTSTVAALFSKMPLTGQRIAMVDMVLLVFPAFPYLGPDLLRKCGALFFMIFLKSPGARTVSTKEMLTENIIATTSGNPFL